MLTKPKPASQQAFRVSDAVRRTKVDGARTRGPQVMVYGDLDFWRPQVLGGATDMRTDMRADRLHLGG